MNSLQQELPLKLKQLLLKNGLQVSLETVTNHSLSKAEQDSRGFLMCLNQMKLMCLDNLLYL